MTIGMLACLLLAVAAFAERRIFCWCCPTTTAWQLYDLSKNRTEMNDLASAHPELAESMAKTWDAWHADIGDLHKPASGKIKLEKKKKERSPRKK